MKSAYRRIGAIFALVVILSTLLVPAALAAPAAGTGVYNQYDCGVCSAAVYYTVRYGDSLRIIAARYGTTYTYLAQLNGLRNPNFIYPGQVLLIRAATPCQCPKAPPQRPAYQDGYCCSNSQPVHVGGYIGPWTGDYFATPDLSGNITVKQLDNAINFNWGWNPPAAGMPNFNWSARWTRFEGNMAGGTYRAQVSVDDGVRVYVDGTCIIDAWTVQALRQYSRDFVIGPGSHTFVVEYFQAQGVSEVHFNLWRVR